MVNVTVVYKKSQIERGQHAPDAPTGEEWAASHERQAHALATVRKVLDARDVAHTVVYRADLDPLMDTDLVIVVGGDGTFIDASHFVEDVPMLGVNSDPVDSIGFFSAATADTFDPVFDGWTELPRHELNRIETRVDGVSVGPFALNDVLIANGNPAATWRGRLTIAGESRRPKNSGVLVSTAAGSTAWSYQEGGRILPLASKELQVILRAVRGEVPRNTGRVEFDILTAGDMLFIDGPHLKYRLQPGNHVEMKPGKTVTVLGDLPEKRLRFDPISARSNLVRGSRRRSSSR